MNRFDLRLVAWEMTRSCNLACVHCRAGACLEPSPGDLTTDEGKALIDGITQVAKPILIMTGGEPLLRDDLFELAAYARDAGLKPVLATNGVLVTREIAKEVASVGIQRVSVSLDGANAAEHDDFRKIPGAFVCSLKGIDNLRAAGVGVQINTTLTKQNRHQLGDMMKLAEEIGASAFHVFLLSEIAADPELGRLALIAEPWDVGGYQLGRGFPGTTWLQWNARYRDDVRRFVRGDAGIVPDLMRRIYGSDDLFPDSREHAYHAFQTVNYIDCHDGFTLYDLVSYNQKHNWKNGHGNQDGMDANYSWNCGYEGDGGAPVEVLALRRKQVKNFFCLLMLSNGIPMFRAGDEFLNTQFGNNNPYNQNNEISWLDWSQLQANQDIFRFFKGMIAFRKSHPSLCRSRFWREDISWYGVGPMVDLTPDSRSLAYCLHGASQADDDIYVMINAYWEALHFQIQEGAPQDWVRIVDTDLSPDDFSESGLPLRQSIYPVAPRSIVVLIRTK